MKKTLFVLLVMIMAAVCICSCGTSGNDTLTTEVSDAVADDAAVPEENSSNESAMGENSDNEEAALGDNSGNEESAPEENLDSADSPSADAVKPADAQNGTPVAHGFGKFVTEDLEGNEVKEDIFAQKDYTMVNLWGTFCPPCIAEMPELQELNETLPDNLQIVGLICDLYYGSADESVKSDAEEIVSSSGVKYTNLMLWPEAAAMISEITQFVPTTFFVDSSGNIVGEPIIGANIDEYKNRIAELAK